MSTKFQGKVIALTGAASGIGLATAKLLAERGAILSIADVQAGPLEKLVEEIKSTGGTITSTVLDVSNRAAVEEWIKSTTATHGKLDGAANLAGVAGRQAGVAGLEEIDDDDFDFIQRVNVKGVLNCLRAEIIAMKEAGKGGSIVNAASICGWRGLMRGGSYNTSKHAVVGLTRSAAVEQGPNQIRVNCIAP
jgi:NAD(P)-dependent dehydrogenase (short-subunit alcohol dehydrogenase family)